MNLSDGDGRHNIIPLKFIRFYHYPVCFARDLFHTGLKLAI